MKAIGIYVKLFNAVVHKNFAWFSNSPSATKLSKQLQTSCGLDIQVRTGMVRFLAKIVTCSTSVEKSFFCYGKPDFYAKLSTTNVRDLQYFPCPCNLVKRNILDQSVKTYRLIFACLEIEVKSRFSEGLFKCSSTTVPADRSFGKNFQAFDEPIWCLQSKLRNRVLDQSLVQARLVKIFANDPRFFAHKSFDPRFHFVRFRYTKQLT